MHHYRCQNVYISATASERIVNTLVFLTHNYQMPQFSSTDILIMAAKDMMDALQNTHLEVPFTHVGDDAISALTELAEFLDSNYGKNQPPALPAAPPKVNPRLCLAK
jgi:hypothetical protein